MVLGRFRHHRRWFPCLFMPKIWIRLLFFPLPKTMFLHWLSEWQGLTGVVESPCECLLHFHSFWSKVILWGFVSDTSFSLFRRSPTSQNLFHSHRLISLCIHSASWVRTVTLWSLTTEYLSTHRVITVLVWLQLIAQVVSGAITRQSQLPFGHTEIALNRTIISSHWQLSLPFLSACHILSQCYLVLMSKLLCWDL